jgi:putative nucleotidyltransferase with HDIG domain
MIHSGRRISLTDLRQGMFVADVFNENDVLLYSARTLITSDQQIESLKNQGVSSVYIISDEPTSEQTETVLCEPDERVMPSGENILEYAHYQQQLKTAGIVHEQALGAIEEAMSAVKMGRMFQSREVVRSTERLVERVVLDPDLYFGLMQIRSIGNYLYSHSVNVAIMTAAFAGALNYSQDKIVDIAVGGMLHDIGKIKLPESIWLKNENCSRKEFESFKLHPAFGVEIVDRSDRKLPEFTRAIIRHHHERWDGGGYPAGLSGESIHETALMCALTDVYDLLTSHTPYHAGCIPQEALARIFQCADVEYPRPLVEQFARLLGIYPVGSFISLKSGEKGLVIRINRSALLVPVVVILVDSHGRHIEKPFVRDLSKGSTHPDDALRYKIECSLDPAGYGIFPSHYFKAVAA